MADEKWFTRTSMEHFQTWDAVADYLQSWRDGKLADVLVEFFLLHGSRDPFYVYVGKGVTSYGGDTIILTDFPLRGGSSLGLTRGIGDTMELRIYGTNAIQLIEQTVGGGMGYPEPYLTVSLTRDGLKMTLPGYHCEIPMGPMMH
ncbi:hypothetical protein HY523_00330 [Candidatus Berkelbacteria bacterium]|nr:hypothetical protein [Candidatus Berkelbacteria bacterium]